MKTHLSSSRIVSWLLCLGLLFPAFGLMTFAPQAAAADAATINTQIRKTTAQIRKAKRITSNARKRKVLKRLKKKLRKLRQRLTTAAADPDAAPVTFPSEITASLVGDPLPIPDDGGTGDPLISTITVASPAGTITDLDVSIFIDHFFNADLDVTLTHVPSGTTVSLFTDIGDVANNDDGIYVRLDDSAAAGIETVPDDPGDFPIVGTFKPEAPAMLSDFNGVNAAGEWRLTVDDDSATLTGTLLSWSLHITQE